MALTVLLTACASDASVGDGPFAREVARAIPQVEAAVGVKFREPPRVEVRTRAELLEFLIAKFDEHQPALQLAGQERAYKLFGLLPDSLDLRSFLLRLLSEQVVGYYDPATKVLYVVTGGDGAGAPSADIRAITITHELVHALQDQQVPLDSVVRGRKGNDALLAAQAVIEGQATLEQVAVMLGGGNMFARLPGGWDRVRQMIRDAQGNMPVLASAPMLVQETLLFPYLSGAEYTRAFKERRPGQSPLADLPVSTEQVMHPERFLDTKDPPLIVTLPRPTTGSAVYEDGLGEFETRLFLHQHLKDVAAASRGATGWGGDRYMVVNLGNRAALVWVTAWDSPFEAAEFRGVLAEAMERRFNRDPGAGGTGAVLRYSGAGRVVEVTAVTVGGHPSVIYVDAPAGAGTRLLDSSRIRVERAP